jgi:hypothetical protein
MISSVSIEPCSSDLDAVPARFLDDRHHFGRRELLRPHRPLERQDSSGRADLDHLGAMLDLVAHRLEALVDAVGDPRRGPTLQDPRLEARRVHVAAGDAERVAARDDPRSRHEALVDRLHQRHVGEALGSEIAHRGEAGVQGQARVARTAQRRVRDGLLGLQVEVPLEIAGQVHVAVDQAWEQRHAGQLEHRGVGRRRFRVDRDDALAAHHDDRRGDRPPCDDVDVAGGAEDGRRRLGCRGLRTQGMEEESAEDELPGRTHAADHRMGHRVGPTPLPRTCC